MTDDWADDVGYELMREAVMACEDSYSIDYAKVAAALRRAKADGMREAADVVAYYAGGDKQHFLAMQEIRAAASKLDPPSTV